MKTVIKTINHRLKPTSNQCYLLPPQELPYYSPFFTGIAKGLRLVSKTVKLGYQQVDLVLDSYKSVGMLICYITKTINPLKYDLKSIGRN